MCHARPDAFQILTRVCQVSHISATVSVYLQFEVHHHDHMVWCRCHGCSLSLDMQTQQSQAAEFWMICFSWDVVIFLLCAWRRSNNLIICHCYNSDVIAILHFNQSCFNHGMQCISDDQLHDVILNLIIISHPSSSSIRQLAVQWHQKLYLHILYIFIQDVSPKCIKELLNWALGNGPSWAWVTN